MIDIIIIMMTSMRMNEEISRCQLDHACYEYSSTPNRLPRHAATGTSDHSIACTATNICSQSSPPLSDTLDQSPVSAAPNITTATPPTSSATAKSGSSSQQSCSSTNRGSSFFRNCLVDPIDVQRIRAETKQLLILCLHAQCTSSSTNDCNKDNSRHRMVVDSLAEKLEQALFDMAPTFTDYSALPTLPLRISLILPRVKKEWKKSNSRSWRKTIARTKQYEQERHEQQEGHNKQQQQHGRSELNFSTAAAITSGSRSSGGDSGRELLREQLGATQYQSIQELVETIRFERNQLVGSSCSNCRRCQQSPSSQQGYDGRIEDKEASPSSLWLTGYSFGSKLDPPVARLFFQTPLVMAWEKRTLHGRDGDKYIDGGSSNSSPQLVTSTVESWTQLQRQAQANLEAFLEWKAKLNYGVCPAPR